MGNSAQLLAGTGSSPQQVDQVDAAIDRSEVLRYLGYPAGVAPNPRLQGILDHWIGEARRLATPRAVFRVLPVAQLDRRGLQLADGTEIVAFRGAIGEFLGAAECVAAFVATAGPGIERRASECVRDGDHLAGMILNAVGAERAEAAESVVIDRLRAQGAPHQFVPTLPYSPGYCGMALTEQRALFRLFAGCDVGVTLTESCLMQPLKSVSGLIGLGPTDRVQAFGSPCERCELYNCNMRR